MTTASFISREAIADETNCICSRARMSAIRGLKNHVQKACGEAVREGSWRKIDERVSRENGEG